MPENRITPGQIKRLQTLWQIFARQARIDPKDRAARLGWVSDVLHAELGSFLNLTMAQANAAIDAIEKHLPKDAVRHRRPSRRLAQAYGTAGRKGSGETEVRLVDAATLKLIGQLVERLGWDRERLDAFLRSHNSPVPGGQLRTLAQANKLIWALKGFLRREAQQARPAAMEEKVPAR